MTSALTDLLPGAGSPPLAARIAASRYSYALKVALTVVLSLFIAFLFNLNHTYWALMTVPLIVRPESGTMVWRSVARMAGTMAGALGGLALALCFAQSDWQVIGAMALMLFLIGYNARMQSGLDAYAQATAGFTALVIVLDAGADPGQGYPLALARATETMIPILCGFIVMLTVFPRSVSDNAAAALGAARGQVLDLCCAVLADRHPHDAAPEKAVMASIGAAHNELRALVYERSRKDWRRPGMAAVAHAMDRLAVAATTLRFAQEAGPDLSGDGDGDGPDPAVARLAALAGALRRPEAAGAAAMLVHAEAAEALAATFREGLAAPMVAENAAAAGSAALGLARAQLAEALAQLARAEAALIAPEAGHAAAAPRRGPAARRYRERVAAVQYGLRPAIMLLVMSAAWLFTGWSAGVAITMIVPALTLLLPTIVPRPARVLAGKALALGLSAGFVIALALMVALSHVEGFPALALLLGATVFVIFAICSSLQTLPLAIGSMIMISIGLQPSNDPAFSPMTLFNIAASMALLPPCFVAALTVIFPEDRAWLQRHLEAGTTRLLARVARDRRPMPSLLFFDEMIDMFTDYAATLDTADPRNARLVRRARAALVAGLACRDLRRLERGGGLDPELAAAGPALRRAAIAAVRARADAPAATDSATFAELPAERAGAAAADRQYRATAEMLAGLIRRGVLARPARRSAAARPQPEAAA